MIPLVVFVGDSMSWSVQRHPWQACEIGVRYGRTDVPRYEMSKSYKGQIWMNLAFPGSQITHLEANAADVDAVLANAGSARRPILVVMIGTNPTSYTPSVAAERIGDYCAARVAAGWEVMICTIPSRLDVDTTFDTDYATPLNAILRGTTALSSFPGEYFMAHYGVDHICDFGAMEVLSPNTTNANNTVYFNADKVHPSDYGGLVMAHKLQGAINDVVAFTGYSQQVEQFLDRLATPPSATMIAAYEAFINGLCDAGLWDAFHGLWLYASETEADSLINLVPTGVTLAKTLDSGALTHTPLVGWLGTTTGALLLTNFNPSSGASPAILNQNDLSIGIWSADAAAMAGWDISGRTAPLTWNSNIALSARWGGNYFQADLNCADSGAVYKGGITDGSGLFIAQRTASNAQSIWRNGVVVTPDAGGTTASVSPANCSIYNCPKRKARAFFIGRHLSSTEQATLYSLMTTFFESIPDEFRTSDYGDSIQTAWNAAIDSGHTDFTIINDSVTDAQVEIETGLEGKTARFATENSKNNLALTFGAAMPNVTDFTIVMEDAGAVFETIGNHSLEPTGNFTNLTVQATGTATGQQMTTLDLNRHSLAGNVAPLVTNLTLDGLLADEVHVHAMPVTDGYAQAANGSSDDGADGTTPGTDGQNPGDAGGKGENGASAGSGATDGTDGTQKYDGTADTANVTLTNGATVTTLMCTPASGSPGQDGGNGGSATGGDGAIGGNGYDDTGGSNTPSNGGQGGDAGGGNAAGDGGDGGPGGNSKVSTRTITVGSGCTITNLQRRSAAAAGGAGGAPGSHLAGTPGGGGTGYSGGTNPGPSGNSASNGDAGATGASGSQSQPALVNSGTVTNDDGA